MNRFLSGHLKDHGSEIMLLDTWATQTQILVISITSEGESFLEGVNCPGSLCLFAWTSQE